MGLPLFGLAMPNGLIDTSFLLLPSQCFEYHPELDPSLQLDSPSSHAEMSPDLRVQDALSAQA